MRLNYRTFLNGLDKKCHELLTRLSTFGTVDPACIS